MRNIRGALFGYRLDALGDVAHRLLDALRRDAALAVVCLLDAAAALRLFNGVLHRVGNAVGVHNDAALNMARRPADGLHKRGERAQIAFLVGVQDGDKTDFRQVYALAQQVDAHHYIVHAQPQIAQDFAALQRVNLRMQVMHLHAHFAQIVGELFRHSLGQRGDDAALPFGDAPAYLIEQVVDLPLGGLDLYQRVEQSGRADDLLDDLLAVFVFIRAGRGGHIDGLVHMVFELAEVERAVVQRRRQPKAELHKRLFAGLVAAVHPAYLRQRHMRFVNEQQVVLREVVH